MPDCRPVPFGHWGDGNIHFNITQPVGMDTTEFLNMWDDFSEIVHGVALSYGGSISAEHGIGVMKREMLAQVKDPIACLLYTSPSPRDQRGSRMPSSA